jgi:hypothetical protein
MVDRRCIAGLQHADAYTGIAAEQTNAPELAPGAWPFEVHWTLGQPSSVLLHGLIQRRPASGQRLP